MRIPRRTVLRGGATLIGCAAIGNIDSLSATDFGSPADLRNLIGVTTGSFNQNLSLSPQIGKLQLIDLPKIMRNELGMRVIDLMTATLPSMERPFLDDFRSQAEKHNCIITNLKMNQPEIDMGSPDDSVRKQAIDVYKSTIDAAQHLGCRWVRPLPRVARPSLEYYIASYRQLIDYAAPKGISLLIENFGWIQDDPDAIPRIVKAVGQGLAACPDTGNWTNAARYEGLSKAFPLAVTCDFKVKALGELLEHPDYDLQRCFQIGWDAGFRGPWCFEHFHKSLPQLLKEMVRLRDMIAAWTKSKSI